MTDEKRNLLIFTPPPPIQGRVGVESKRWPRSGCTFMFP